MRKVERERERQLAENKEQIDYTCNLHAMQARGMAERERLRGGEHFGEEMKKKEKAIERNSSREVERDGEIERRIERNST